MMLLVALALVAAVAARSSTEKISLDKVAKAGRHTAAKKVSVRYAVLSAPAWCVRQYHCSHPLR
jgi:hypothetical protein